MSNDGRDRIHKEQMSFLERHRDANVLVYNERTKECTEVIYHSPMKKWQDSEEAWARMFFQQVREGQENLRPDSD